MKSSTTSKSTNVRLWSLRTAFWLVARVSETTAARLLEYLFLRVRAFPVPERERDWLEEATEIAFESGGQRLSAWQWGVGGATVLLMHGWQGRGSQLGAFAAPLVARGYRVIALDGPGHGRSRKGGSTSSSIIEIAHAILDAERTFGRFDAVIAHSGGGAATLVALDRGLDLSKAVLIGTASELQSFFDEVVLRLGLSPRVGRLAQDRMEARFGIRWDDLERCTTAPSLRLSDGLELLIVHDHDDREVPIESAERIHAGWPQSRFHTTRGLGHRRILRDPGVVAEVVTFVGAPGRARSKAAPAPRGSSRPASRGGAPGPRPRTTDPGEAPSPSACRQSQSIA